MGLGCLIYVDILKYRNRCLLAKTIRSIKPEHLSLDIEGNLEEAVSVFAQSANNNGKIH
jgi:hypothetical protein